MESSIYDQMSLSEDGHWWFVGRRRIVAALLTRFVTKQAVQAVLEVGCGTGGNLAWLSQYGRLAAIELDDRAIAAATRRSVCRVLKGSLPDDVPVEGKFDLIAMLDVLEHVDQDREAMKTLATKLNDDGFFLITVPAYMFLWSAHDELHHHKRRYTRAQLESLVTQAGLKVAYSTYFNTLLFPLALVMKWWNRWIDSSRSVGVDTPSTLVNRLLLGLFLLEIPLLKLTTLPFGVSILLIAQKIQDK